MRILSTHHVALYTGDFERLRDFYAVTLGLPIVGAFPDQRIAFIGAGSSVIELIQEDLPAGEGDRSGWNHVALEVDDVDEAYAELGARGVRFHVPPEDFPSDNPSFRIAFFRDLDGNAIELIQPLASRYPPLEE